MIGLYRTKQDYTGLYRTIKDYTGQYRTVKDHAGLWGTIQDYIEEYRGLIKMGDRQTDTQTHKHTEFVES